MKYSITLFLLWLGLTAWGQTPGVGTLVTDTLYSEYLENDFDESATRSISVYLPPFYDQTETKYPVIYFLHGFLTDDKLMYQMKELLDYAINENKIDPFIMVVPDQKTTYDGSFYSNSGLFGDWEDFTVKDLVSYMDTHFRTLPKKESRGITGHSMGGYGAIKLAMKHPEVFGSVYALSPGALAIVREYGPNSNTYKQFAGVTTMEDLEKTYFGKVIVAFGRSWSPNPNKPPFYCDVPFEYTEGTMKLNEEVLGKWHQNMPFYMVPDYINNLKKLRAIKLDWGRNAGERFTIQCKMLSQQLENVGVPHFAEEYIGTHVNNIYTQDGRLPQQVLPFFDFYLDFE